MITVLAGAIRTFFCYLVAFHWWWLWLCTILADYCGLLRKPPWTRSAAKGRPTPRVVDKVQYLYFSKPWLIISSCLGKFLEEVAVRASVMRQRPTCLWILSQGRGCNSMTLFLIQTRYLLLYHAFLLFSSLLMSWLDANTCLVWISKTWDEWLKASINTTLRHCHYTAITEDMPMSLTFENDLQRTIQATVPGSAHLFRLAWIQESVRDHDGLRYLWFLCQSLYRRHELTRREKWEAMSNSKSHYNAWGSMVILFFLCALHRVST